MELKDLNVIFINFNNYLENPLAKYCYEENCKKLKGAKIKILDGTDINEYFSASSILSDFIKLSYLLERPNTLFIDLDSIISDESINYILNNPNKSAVLEYCGFGILYFSEKDSEPFIQSIGEIQNIGFDKYIALGADKHLMNFFKKERCVLSTQNHFYLSSNFWRLKKFIISEKDFNISTSESTVQLYQDIKHLNFAFNIKTKEQLDLIISQIKYKNPSAEIILK